MRIPAPILFTLSALLASFFAMRYVMDRQIESMTSFEFEKPVCVYTGFAKVCRTP